MILDIKGDIIADKWRKAYAFFGFDHTSPAMVRDAFANLPAGDRMQVRINSPGGDVLAGQEIYTFLRDRDDVDIVVESLAGSAASVIAMAGPSSISPVGMLMIHDVSIAGATGNKNDMQKTSQVLAEYDKALAQAYIEKTGKTVDEILSLMDEETWLTAPRAVEMGFIDQISKGAQALTNTCFEFKVTPAMMEQYEKEKADILQDLDAFGSRKED